MKTSLSTFQRHNMHGAGRPVVAIPIELRRAATKWCSAYLPGQDLVDLQTALATLLRHPEQASTGYSKAKEARQRVQLELNRRAAAPSQ